MARTQKNKNTSFHLGMRPADILDFYVDCDYEQGPADTRHRTTEG